MSVSHIERQQYNTLLTKIMHINWNWDASYLFGWYNLLNFLTGMWTANKAEQSLLFSSPDRTAARS